MRRRRIALAGVGLALLISGCKTTDTSAPLAAEPPSPSPEIVVEAIPEPSPTIASHLGGIAVSHASSTTLQQQPPAGSCHQRGSGDYALQDARCTPGALNPDVTQASIDSTICVSGYTKTIRPSSSISGREKVLSLGSYGDPNTPSAYEYDHLISLELGGAANDARNLWPEPGGSPNPKDSLENRLHSLVCSGQITLIAAQLAIATDWVSAYHSYIGATPKQTVQSRPTTTTAPQSASGGSCNANVSDPQPSGGQETVTVHTTANAGVQTVAHYKTRDTEHDGTADGSGVAKISFSIGRPSHGYTVQVTISTSSGQTCSTSFTPQ